ncbi:MAG: CHAT domain-containing protein, partial [Cyclobacteriaceae bacterium]|nr:CHAT domain-containing protein [Cyclobacteriaceae bacterium]
MYKLLVLFVIILLHSLTTQAQIDKLLKNKAKSVITSSKVKNAVKKHVNKELEEMKTEYDTSSFNYAIALNDQAGLFESKERYERQKKILISYAQRKTDDISDLDRARDWVDRAEMLYANGKYKLAYGLLLGARIIYEDENATDEAYYAKSIANLSLVSHSLGRLQMAMHFANESLDLREKLFGKNSRGYAASLNNYALILKDLGQYNEAEKMLEEAVTLNRDVVGKESMGYAITLNNKAVFEQSLGRFESAENTMKEALAIAAVHLKGKSADYQRLQVNLALLYQDMKRYDESEKIYLEAIEIKKKRMGTSHPDYAHLLNNLASLYMEMERYEEVEELLKQSIEIYTSRLGPEHPATANANSDLGNYYLFRQEYDKAQPLFAQALEARQNRLGRDHPDYLQSAEDMAIVHWKKGELEKATSLYREVMKKSLDHINTFFMPMSEAEKTRYWNLMKPRFERFYSFVTDHYNQDPTLLNDLYNYHIATKAILLNSGNKIRQHILASHDLVLIDKYNTWLDQKEALAHYYSYSKEELADENINIDSLEKAANSSEKYLSENSDVFASELTGNVVTYMDVRGALAKNEAAVEIVRINYYSETKKELIYYIGLIVKSGAAHPEWVLWEKGENMETRFYRFYNNAIRTQLRDDYSYDIYWEPLARQLGDIQTIYLSMDGVYNQININTLRNKKGVYVLNNTKIINISNTKVVPGIKAEPTPGRPSSAFLLGYPEYGGDGSIAMLPGTKTEVENIRKIMAERKLTAKSFLGTEATEKAVKELKDSDLIHIATHGYFLEDMRKGNNK